MESTTYFQKQQEAVHLHNKIDLFFDNFNLGTLLNRAGDSEIAGCLPGHTAQVQLRDYDGLIGHTTIVMIRYLFLAFEQRLHDDPRTLGTLFHACVDEVKDISVLETLQRIMKLALDKVRTAGEFAEDIIMKILDAVMSVAIDMLKPPSPIVAGNNS